jgi:hypothetical protein
MTPRQKNLQKPHLTPQITFKKASKNLQKKPQKPLQTHLTLIGSLLLSIKLFSLNYSESRNDNLISCMMCVSKCIYFLKTLLLQIFKTYGKKKYEKALVHMVYVCAQ